MNIFYIFLNSNILIQLIILVLLCLSIFSWSIIMQYVHLINTANHAEKVFTKKFLSGMKLSDIYQDSIRHKTMFHGSEKIFCVGFKEFSLLNEMSNHYSLKEILKRTLYVMKITKNIEIQKLKKNTPYLRIIAIIGPCIGIFGTIFKFIDIFIQTESIKFITLQIIVSGISAALIFTVVGLFIAIPAIVALYYLNIRLQTLEQNYNNFLEEFISILEKNIFPIT